MATERGNFSTLSLGIQDTEVLGNYEAAEAFLSETPLQNIDKAEEEEAKRKELEEAKKKAQIKAKEEIEIEKEEEIKDPLEEELEEEPEEEETKDPQEIPYNALAKSLLRLGIFTEMEGEEDINTPEELLTRFQMEKQMGATQWLENFLSKYGDDRREMFDAIFINGVDPKEYIPAFNQVQDFENLDISSEENQRIVYREYLKRQGFASEVVEKKLQKALDYGDLEEDSKAFHERLVAEDKKKLSEIAEKGKLQEEKQKRLDADYKANLQKTLTEAVKNREFKGFPLTEKKAGEVFDFLYSPKYKTADGKLLTEFDKFILESKSPDNIEQRVLIALLKSENFDFSKIEKKAISNESKTLFSELAQKVQKSKNRDISKTTTEAKKNVWSNL